MNHGEPSNTPELTGVDRSGEQLNTPGGAMPDRPTQGFDGVFRRRDGKPAAPDNAKYPEQAKHVMELLVKYWKLVNRGEKEAAEKPIKSLDSALRILGLEGQEPTRESIMSAYTGLLQYAHPDKYTHAGQEVHGGFDRAKIIGGFTQITRKIDEAKKIALNSLS